MPSGPSTHRSLPVSALATGHRRLEAGLYLSDGFSARWAIERSGLRTPRLGDLAQIWQPARLKAVTVADGHGVPFLVATEAFSIDPQPKRWLATAKTPDLADRFVSAGWLLVTRSGTVGNAMTAFAPHLEFVVSDDLLRIVSHTEEMRGYIYLFLRTRFGRAMMQASQYGTVIKHLETMHLEEMPVPIVDRLTDWAHSQAEEIFATRTDAYELDTKARDRLGEALDDEAPYPDERAFSVSASSLFEKRRRLEASAYSPIAKHVLSIYERSARSVVPLESVARTFIPGRFKRIYGERGIPYLDSKPIFQINPRITKFLTPATNIDFQAYQVQRGWLLMERSGTIGPTTLVNEGHEGKVITEHIMRIVPNPELIRAGYLRTVLAHPTLGQPLVTSLAYGTSVPELAAEDADRIPIPRLASRLEDEIAEAAESASELRLAADRQENDAVAHLESVLERELAAN